jgi:hypothetical protein
VSIENGPPFSSSQLRPWYRQAVKDSLAAQRFWNKLKGYRGDHGLNLAYKGVARSLVAKNSWNPMEKLRFLNEAAGFFKQAVRHAPENIEIRFLRFSIEHYTPSFVGLSNHLREDKDVFLTNLHRFAEFELTEEEVRLMANFLEESKRCSRKELENMWQSLSSSNT